MNGSATTQIHLYEDLNLIEFHSLAIDSPGDTMTQGIENANGTEGYAPPGRNDFFWNAYNDYVVFIPNTGGFPDNEGNEVSVSIDIDTFTCDDLGENTVVVIATDSEGNMSSCTAVVTVVANLVTLAIDETFCEDQDIIMGLGGGLPVGGIYSGTGVTDDGNGETFTFDPSIAGEGAIDIMYGVTNSCNSVENATVTVNILSSIPEIVCQDLEINLTVNGEYILDSEQILLTGSMTDNCSDEPLTFTVTPNTFTCDDLGENGVTIIATDSNGNTSSCSSIVTILPFDANVTFTSVETSFCIDGEVMTGLGGGLPEGGVYSGSGVIDDGNGLTFIFDPSTAGVANHDISYTYIGICNNEDVAVVAFEVLAEIPALDECPDVTIALDSSCEIILTPESLVSGGVSGKLYGMRSFTFSAESYDIRRYDYNSFTDEISIDSQYSYLSGLEKNYSLTKHPLTKETFLLGGDESGVDLYTFDISNEDSELTFVSNMISIAGDEFPYSMEFDGQGNLYVLYLSGEINILDVNDMTLSPLEVELPVNEVGNSEIGNITYDDDHDRFLFIRAHSSTLRVFEFQIATQVFNELFEYTLEGYNQCIGVKTVEYLGNDKIIASTDINTCGTIYTLDLNTQEVEVLLNPTSTDLGIKELHFIKGLPIDNCSGEPLTYEIDPPILTCDDVGENIITITATDSAGNTSVCTPTVTIVPFLGIQCTDITVLLDETGVASITLEDILTEPVEGASLDISEFSCSDLGEVIVTASVNQGGETISCQATVTVIDNTDPVIVECPDDIIVTADPEDNMYILEDFTTSAIFSDTCDIDYLLQDPPVGTVIEANDGSHIDITAVDISGNISQECSFFLTVDDPIDDDDLEPGLFTGQYYMEEVTYEQNAPPTLVNLDNNPVFILFETTTDSPQGIPLSINERSFNGIYKPILFDNNPIIFIIDFDEDTGNVTIVGSTTVGNTVCGGEIYLGPATGGEFDPTDDSEFIVSFSENLASVCIDQTDVILVKFTREAPFETQCTDITVALDENGEASISPEDILGESVEGTSLDISEFSCSDVGEVVVTVILNEDGETSSCDATVTVVDAMAPIITDMPENGVVYVEEGETTYILEDFTDIVTVSDNCTIDTMITQDPQPGAIFNIGDTVEVVISATDTSGNVNERSFVLTIEEPLSVADNLLATGISVYPNPTTDVFTIKNSSEVILDQAILTDIRGRVLKTIKFNGESLETLVSLESYRSGIYFIGLPI